MTCAESLAEVWVTLAAVLNPIAGGWFGTPMFIGTVTARRLAEFLQSVEAEETLLAQRVRDRESRDIRLGIVAVAQSGDAVLGEQAPARPEHIAPTLDEAIVGEMYGEF